MDFPDSHFNAFIGPVARVILLPIFVVVLWASYSGISSIISPVTQPSTATFFVPYLPNPHFVGRSEILNYLKQELGVSQNRSITRRFFSSQKRVCLYGPSGIGKTQITLAYAYWLRASCPEASVFWVQASTVERFHESYACIAEECNIPGHTDPGVDLLRLVKAWLEKNHNRPWLMIINNADDAELLFQTTTEEKLSKVAEAETHQHRGLVEYIPECSHGSVLLTTRDSEYPLVRGASLIKVENLEDPDIHHLVQGIMDNEPVKAADATVLSSRLEESPLALTLAASFMKTRSIPIGQYLRLLDKADIDLVDRLSKPHGGIGRDSSTPHAVAAVWLISFQYIEQKGWPRDEMLNLASCVNRHGIPKEFMGKYFTTQTIEGVTIEKREYFETLAALSFLLERKDSFYLNYRGKWEEATVAHAQTVFQQAMMLGEEHPDTLTTMERLTLIYLHQCRFREAEIMQLYVWGVKNTMLGEENSSTRVSKACFDLTEEKMLEETRRLILAPTNVRNRAQNGSYKFPWNLLIVDMQASIQRSEAIPELPSNLPQLVDAITNRLPFRPVEPPIPKGHSRHCGQQLFDDFIASTPESLQELQKDLQELERGAGMNNQSDQSSQGYQLLSNWPTVTLHDRLSRLLKANDQDSMTLPMHHVNMQAPQPTGDTALHLLMCIDRGRHFTRLYQNLLQNVENDFKLFHFMREQAFQHQGIRPWLTFRSVTAVSLARFEVDNSQFAEVHNHRQVCGPDCVCIPPTERVESEEYQCSPSPTVKPSQVPVIGTNRLTHYFLKPHAFHKPQRIILNQLPKLAQGPLGTSEDTMQLGWGIHIQEGWHWKTIYFVLVFVFIIGSLVFGITWSVVEGDIQSAFAVTATWMAIGPLLLGYIAVRDLQ
ncbi:hypothetical protein NM208_g2500 [Fusarium decemcellulare]|uniref:Uncharacterized protein n=1 Tax=Fusarium decemcellulare TaxID=57161 RepID=A0ACC1SSA8_9HYPO|nr:hypothetical protein NM208_g2500 [Fusarium decemcellulare]